MRIVCAIFEFETSSTWPRWTAFIALGLVLLLPLSTLAGPADRYEASLNGDRCVRYSLDGRGFSARIEMDFRKMFFMYREFQRGAPLGDVAVLKMDALAKVPRDLENRLTDIQGYAPDQNLEELRAMPEDSLGRCYAAFLDAQGIQPLTITGVIKERYRDNPFPIRFTTTHDLHHLLTGFDAGIAGEAGVAAFNVGQGSANFSWKLLRVARWVYTVLSPSNARAVWHNLRLGRRLGREAELVMAYRLEDDFCRPLAEVRERLRIPDPQISGVQSSRPSRFIDWAYRNRSDARINPA